MANSITLAKKYTSLLDEVYQKEALTSALDSSTELTREGANANEIIIPKMELDGLANYSRSTGYVRGDSSLTWETVTFNFDRGRRFDVDAMDNEETMQLAFGKLAGTFERTKVIPELDAFRFAQYCDKAGTKITEEITAANVVSALRAAKVAMDNAEVPTEGRILYLTPALDGMLADLDTTKSKAVLAGFSQKFVVPEGRFYSAIEQLDGVTDGEKTGGYKKADGAVGINFLAIHPTAVLQYTKHAITKIVPPERNNDADAWIYNYRSYGLSDCYENKLKGVYASIGNV